MCSSNVSDPANRLRKTRKKKSSVVPPVSQRSHVGNLRQIRKQGKGRSSKRKENRRLSFLFAPRRGYGVIPPRRAPRRSRRPQTANPPAEVQRKTLRPERANPPAAVRVSRTIGAEKEPPRRGEHACGSSCAPHNRCRKGAAPSGRTRSRSSSTPLGRCRKNFSNIFKKLTIHGQFSPSSGIGLKEVTQ